MRYDRPPRPAPPPAASAPARPARPSKHLTLLVIAITGLMLILDLTITNVALPTIQQALRMTPQGLQWVVNAYALGYGGFLLLGGRLADRLGRRRVFMAGVAVFTLASLLGGLAPAGGILIAARGLQGLGAALAGPAGLSILTTTFAEGPERNRALGVWSAVLASGGAIGMLVGGLLTQYASWRWVLFVNVPVGVLVLLATPRVVPAAPGQLRVHVDVAGAVTVTAGLVALVYATSQVSDRGWSAPPTLGWLLLSAVLLGAFLAIESRRRAPLVPLGIFRHRSLAGADTVALLGGAAVIASPIFFLTLYLQQILGFSAVQAGLATLPLALAVIAASRLTPKLVTTVGPRRPLAGGLALAAAGLVLLGRIHPAGSYPTDVLGPIVLLGLGMGLSFVPLTASATAGVPPADQGLASGLLQTAQQLGVALGLAALTSVAAATSQGLLGPGHAGGPPDPAALQAALTSGYAAALRGTALLALAGATLTLLILPPRRPAPIHPPNPPATPPCAHPASNPPAQGAIMSAFSNAELAYLQGERRLARLATVGPDGTPHVTPVGMWTIDPDTGVVEVTGHDFAASKKFRDVARTHRAAIVVDDVLPPWRPRGVEIRGRADAISDPEPAIRIHPERIIGWGLDDHGGGRRHARDVR